MTKPVVELGEMLWSDPRSERRRARVDGAEVELRVVKPGLSVDVPMFLRRLEALGELSHPSLRTVRDAVVLDDGRPAAVLSLVPWTTLLRNTRQPVAALVAMGTELAEALATLHGAGLVLGQVSPTDLFPGQPAVLDASLLGLAGPSATPEGDARMLAQVLLTASPGSPEAGAFEAVLQRAMAVRATAAELGKMLESLRAAPAQQGAEVELLEPQLEGHTLSRWKVGRVLGEGAMAKVYLAVDTRSGDKVALKVLKQEHLKEPEYVHRFVQEVRAVTAIAHEHIVKVTDFGDELLPDGRRCVYCVMEMLEGMELAQAINQGPFSIERTTKLCRQLSQALHAAHQVGVVHRDVKPENIFLSTRHGQPDFVKVLDFGIAKLLKPIDNLPSVGTKAGIVVGTPEYMAPEQAMGAAVDARVDVYAVGLVMYELLSGSLPFASDTFGQMLVDITQKPVPPLPDRSRSGEVIPQGLRAVVLRCLEKDPQARFPSAAALEEALATFCPSPHDDVALLAAVRPSRVPQYAALLLGLGLIAALGWILLKGG